MHLKNHYFLLRHGRTVYQERKKGFIYPSLRKQESIGLIPESKRKLKKTAGKIVRDKIDLIYSSDIYRVRQTAGIVAQRLGLKINFDKRLRDTGHGIYSGRTKEEFYRVFPDPKKRFKAKTGGVESWNEVKKRAASFLKDIDKKYKNKNILVASHGDVLWLLEGIIKRMTEQRLLDEIFVRKNYIQPEEYRKL